MRKSLFAATVAGVATLGFSASPSIAQDNTDQQFGTVHFETSCNETAQRRFDRAMRYQHSFWYKASKEIFEETLKADPECAIAYWGIALGLLDNPHNPPPAPNLPLGLAAIQKAKATGAKTQRERDYHRRAGGDVCRLRQDPASDARSVLPQGHGSAGREYPDDDEAQIFYAITLNVAASPTDKTYANQLKGAAILEPIFKRQPQHPGVAHYLIHLYDYPRDRRERPRRRAALRQDRADAPHAQHMPSHIFTRVGYWKESIAANIASVQAAKADKEARRSAARAGLSGLRLSAARSGQECARRHRRHGQASDLRSGCLRRRILRRPPRRRATWWSAATGKARRSLRSGRANFPHVMAITHFARALGAARSGNPDAAKADIAKLAELRDKLRRPRTAIGRTSSTSSSRSRPPGCSTPKANTTRRSRS